MTETNYEFEYQKLADAILTSLQEQGFLAACRVATPVEAEPTVTGDDCVNLRFTLNGVVYSFKKAGKDSWVETIKYAHRNGKKVSVTDSGRANGDKSRIPSDIHDA